LVRKRVRTARSAKISGGVRVPSSRSRTRRSAAPKMRYRSAEAEPTMNAGFSFSARGEISTSEANRGGQAQSSGWLIRGLRFGKPQRGDARPRERVRESIALAPRARQPRPHCLAPARGEPYYAASCPGWDVRGRCAFLSLPPT